MNIEYLIAMTGPQKREALKRLNELKADFSTGYISNPSSRAERKRAKHEKTVDTLLALLNAPSTPVRGIA